jgi:hypothetical protein
MNDTKLRERSEEEVRNEMRIVKTISNDIIMEIGLQKCVEACLISGKVHKNNIQDTQLRL